jgi:para-nitrobenzyl esterase
MCSSFGRLLLVAIAASPSCAVQGEPDERAATSEAEVRKLAPRVHVRQGWLEGESSDGVDRFLGIPYAAPPVGELRWRPPEAPKAWEGTRAANTLPPICAQPGWGDVEDCLYLNVYRPARSQRKGRLPVLFYIHGGGLVIGYSGENDPSRLAAATDSVVVTINYRLGVFGFLAHPSLGEEACDGTSGEYGMLDQQAALRWVNTQIAAFGGDPSRVTISGYSAGGYSVCAHLASPSSAGLFSGAVIQSAGCLSRSLAEAEAQGSQFVSAAGCAGASPAACLRQKSAAELIAADTPVPIPPVAGARVLPEPSLAAVSAGRFHRVPVLLGGTKDELRGGLLGEYPMSEEQYLTRLGETFGPLAGAVHEEYATPAYPQPFDAFSAAFSDSGIGAIGSCTTLRVAQALANYVPTYMYEFDDPDAPAPGWAVVPEGLRLGSTHGSDEPYLFDRPFYPDVEPLDEQQRGLSRQMMQYWGAFVEDGAPRVARQPSWPRFEAGRERVLRLRPQALRVLRNFSDEHHCGFWSELGF